MHITPGDVKRRLKTTDLRVKSPRVADFCAFALATTPLSCSEVLSSLGEMNWDPATVYRNLVKLRDEGLIVVVSRANGIDRYALAHRSDESNHPHVVCDDCGQESRLPVEVTPAISEDGRWTQSLRQAAVDLRGEYPNGLEGPETVTGSHEASTFATHPKSS